MEEADRHTEREPLDQPWPWITIALVLAMGIWLLYRDRDVTDGHGLGWFIWTFLAAGAASWGGWTGARTKRVRGPRTGPKTAVIGMTTLGASLAGAALARESDRFVSPHGALWFIGAVVVGFMIGYIAFVAWWAQKSAERSGHVG